MSPIPHEIVVPTDFSPGSDRALDEAIDVAKVFDASIDLVYVDQLPSQELPMVFGYYDLEEGGYYAYVQRGLDERAARVQAAGLRCRTTQLEGRPAAEIVRHSREIGAQMIVMGTHGRTGIAHAVLGSVAERVVQRAGCPVLTVPVATEAV